MIPHGSGAQRRVAWTRAPPALRASRVVQAQILNKIKRNISTWSSVGLSLQPKNIEFSSTINIKCDWGPCGASTSAGFNNWCWNRIFDQFLHQTPFLGLQSRISWGHAPILHKVSATCIKCLVVNILLCFYMYRFSFDY